MEQNINTQLCSLLDIMKRELDDFSQTMESSPKTVSQRFDDLFALVKSAKALSNNIDRDIERYAITTKPDLDHIGKTAAAALEYFDNGEYDGVRDLIIEIHREIYPNAWQPVKR